MEHHALYWDLRKMAEKAAIVASRRLPDNERALAALKFANECEQFALELWFRGYGY